MISILKCIFLFLVLPYLRKYCTTQAIPLDQLIRDEEFPETERLLKSSGLKYLTMISDRKVSRISLVNVINLKCSLNKEYYK